MEFDRLGVFTYSREEDTPAAEMDGQIDEEVKEARRDEIMQIQQDMLLTRVIQEWENIRGNDRGKTSRRRSIYCENIYGCSGC